MKMCKSVDLKFKSKIRTYNSAQHTLPTYNSAQQLYIHCYCFQLFRTPTEDAKDVLGDPTAIDIS
jgi:hypothetical protein